MECIFLNAAGTTLFVRDDMESGHWVQEQMNVTADFPIVAGKVIQIGQLVAFRDPVTDNLEVFEIINVVNLEPDHFQQITAEHICITELSDEHINSTEITDKTASQALTTALTGTLWAVGNSTASGTQSADFSRGSVWDAVNTIQQNWNVYITPRVVISSAGVITGRYLDIAPAQGVWRGLRLSVRKNLYDPSVTYDESEVYTALYGYGGSVEVTQTGQDDKTEELTFKDIVWTATGGHPAKPAGQTYIEWPEKTALYARNGRPRFGYYQNGNIKDANLLLQKTWESLQKSCEPTVNITGTCVDFYRLGYKDQPIRLHDMAIVEIEETGEQLYRQVICNDVDLINPTGTRPQIGDYVPNIIYINRDINEKASGGGGGGGGRGSMTNLEDELTIHETWFEKNDDLIGLFAGIKNGEGYLKVGQICLAINDSDEILAYINADHVNISATNTAHMLAGSIVYDAQGNLVIKESSGAGVLVERTQQGQTATFGVWDRGNLTGGVMVQQINGQTAVKISGDVIDINGSSIVINADRIDVNGIVSALSSLSIQVQSLTVDGEATMDSIDASSIDVSGTIIGGDATFDSVGIPDGELKVGAYNAMWKGQSVVTSVTQVHYGAQYFALTSDGQSVSGSAYINPVTNVSSTSATLYYLGL
jgi:phage minor structural protein